MDEEGIGEVQESVGWERPSQETVTVETGRGNSVNVAVGSPFVETVESIANQANYGGYFRVFLNGDEIVNPAESPASIQSGQRITITPYDKVGA